MTFDTKLDAAAWLADSAGEPLENARPPYRLREYAEVWLAQRDLKPRTRAEYRSILDRLILPALGDARLANVTPARVRAWYATLNPGTPTHRARTYGVLRTIMSTAFADDLVPANPCRIRSAGNVARKRVITIATPAELDAIVEAIPARYKAMVLLAAWCALRFGELTELRRADVDLVGDVVRVRRGVTRLQGEFIVGEPKTEAGKRDVAIPPHIVPTLKAHLETHVGTEPTALLFPARGGGHMSSSTLDKVWRLARKRAGRPDLRFHDLRHTGATMAAHTGATLVDLMNRLGHTSPGAALRYQHAAQGKDQLIAAAMSRLAATGGAWPDAGERE